MRIASVADVKAKLSAYLKASEEELVVITRNGKAIAVILPIEDDAELERLVLSYSKQFQAILHQAKQEIAEGKGIPHDAFWANIEADEDEDQK